MEDKMERFINSNQLLKTRYSQAEIELLSELYAARDFEPLMVISDSTFSKYGNQLQAISFLGQGFGTPSHYILKSDDSLHPIEKELNAVINLSRYMGISKSGFYNYQEQKPKDLILPSTSKLQQFFSIKNAKKQEQFIINCGPVSDTNYRYFAEGLLAFAKTHPIDTVSYDSKALKAVANEKKSFSIKQLRAKGYMGMQYSAKLFEQSLLSFKSDNGLDSTVEINDYTLEALGESNRHRLDRAAISLDKLRQKTNYGSKYVRINIPEYNLYFYANDSLKAIHRVVVGKRTTPTPTLTSEIRTLIIYPYWRVPSSIIKKEIMPDVYRNPAYLDKHHYKLCRYNDTARINPSSINWSARPGGFNVIQMPGRWNSLGIIKFEFLSSESVYVHDTPQKGFFNRHVRSFSHGCMRCQNPIELGKLMLQYDQEGRRRNSMRPDTLDSLVRIGKHTALGLKTRIPIFVEYQTVTTHNRKITFHIDIYFKEEEILANIAKQQTKKKPRS